MAPYRIKSIFYSIQGEGANAGRPAVFCRFAGCNLWSGREEDRPGAVCRFCDTDFVGTDGPGGGEFGRAEDLAATLRALWPEAGGAARPFVVCTGGEPLLQMDAPLIAALHAAGFEIAVETNGTRPAPAGIDWLCVSPKAGAALAIREGDELKLAYPQEGAPPELFEAMAFRHFFLQPIDGPELARNTQRALQCCLARPRWRISPQMQKILGVP